MQKRAQVTLFIILGVVVLMAAVLVFSLNNNNNKGQNDQAVQLANELPQEISPVNPFVQDCIKSTLKEAVDFVSLQGGYYDRPTNSYMWSFVFIPFYYDSGANWVPTKETLEQELSKYVNDNLPVCTNGFSAFKSAGLSVTESPITSSIKLSNSGISSTITYPIDISKGTAHYKLSEFQTVFPTRLFQFYNYSNMIVSELQKKPNYVPLSFILALGKKSGFKSELTYENDSTVIFGLVPTETQDPSPAVYAFAARFDWPSKSEKRISLSTIPQLNATVGYKFEYKLPAKGANLTFSAFTNMFAINATTGLISFTPKYKDRGTHRVLVKVKDKNSYEDATVITMNILSENDPPKIEPVPDQKATVGQLFTYHIIASDPNNDSIFFLPINPSNLKIDTLTGLLTFNPTSDQKGVQEITIMVVDIRSAVTKLTFKVTVE